MSTVAAPHRVWGPETNDLVLQLRKRKISKVILGGMLANMCIESHLRELLEQGFEVAVAKDATAAPKHPEWGYGYEAALINFAFLAHAVLTTDPSSRRWSMARCSAGRQAPEPAVSGTMAYWQALPYQDGCKA